MLYRQRPQGLRLGIDLEAEALMSNSGGNAYWIACRRAEEASSEEIAKDWSGVANAIRGANRENITPPEDEDRPSLRPDRARPPSTAFRIARAMKVARCGVRFW